MLYFFLFLLLVILAVFIVSINISAFLEAFDLGPFSEKRHDGIFLIIVMWTIGLPGKILGTVVGIVTFQFLDW